MQATGLDIVGPFGLMLGSRPRARRGLMASKRVARRFTLNTTRRWIDETYQDP